MKLKLSDITDGTLTKEQAEALQSYFQEGGTWHQLLQLSESEVEEVYAAGYAYFEKGEFNQALTAFATLAHLSPYISKHWIAIGAASQALEQYGEAINAYEFALVLQPDCVQAYFYLAQCYYALNQMEKVVEALKKVVEGTSVQDPLHERAVMILGTLPQGPKETRS